MNLRLLVLKNHPNNAAAPVAATPPICWSRDMSKKPAKGEESVLVVANVDAEELVLAVVNDLDETVNDPGGPPTTLIIQFTSSFLIVTPSGLLMGQ